MRVFDWTQLSSQLMTWLAPVKRFCKVRNMKRMSFNITCHLCQHITQWLFCKYEVRFSIKFHGFGPRLSCRLLCSNFDIVGRGFKTMEFYRKSHLFYIPFSEGVWCSARFLFFLIFEILSMKMNSLIFHLIISLIEILETDQSITGSSLKIPFPTLYHLLNRILSHRVKLSDLIVLLLFYKC